MHSNLRKGLFLVTLLGAVAIPGIPAAAADSNTSVSDTMPGVGIEAVLNDCYSQNKEIKVEDYLVPTNKGEYLDMAFANVTSYLYIRSEPTKESEWVGKLYPGYAAKITGPVGEWTPIRSGEVTGYVKTEFITTGGAAEEFAVNLVNEAKSEGKEEVFTYAESKEQEEARLQAEAEAQAQAEAEARAAAEAEAREKAGSGQAIVDYACQFIGNPYVWGGTSLTNGADCSGFVQSVFAHFGVSMPRTSYEQRSAGVAVSYEQAIPGDIVCYDGHVGIYMGDGQIVNAMNPALGIGISPAAYTTIVAVRRVL